MYYPLDGVPEFWEWIDHQATNGRIKLPVEVLDEVLAGSKKEDPLLDWMTAHKDVLRLKEKVDPSLVNKVVTEGYAPDLTDDELIEIGQDSDIDPDGREPATPAPTEPSAPSFGRIVALGHWPERPCGKRRPVQAATVCETPCAPANSDLVLTPMLVRGCPPVTHLAKSRPTRGSAADLGVRPTRQPYRSCSSRVLTSHGTITSLKMTGSGHTFTWRPRCPPCGLIHAVFGASPRLSSR